MREVLIDFLVVHRLSLELFPHFLLQNAVVVNSRVVDVEAVKFAGQSFQQSTASATGSSEYNAKLARSDDAVEAVENLLAL